MTNIFKEYKINRKNGMSEEHSFNTLLYSWRCLSKDIHKHITYIKIRKEFIRHDINIILSGIEQNTKIQHNNVREVKMFMRRLKKIKEK